MDEHGLAMVATARDRACLRWEGGAQPALRQRRIELGSRDDKMSLPAHVFVGEDCQEEVGILGGCET